MGSARHMIRRRLAAAGLLVGLAAAAGCALVPGNPFLPSARLTAFPEPAMIQVNYTYKVKDETITAEPQEVKYKIRSFPNDGTPGVRIHSYTAEYLDMNSREIPTLFLAKANFGITAYVPPASPQKASEVTLELPVYNQQVRLYGDDLAYSFAGGASLNRNWSHTIMARVTLIGEDDNLNQIQLPMDVPIRFTAQIVQ